MPITTDAILTVTVAPGQPDETPRRTPGQLLPKGRTTVMSITELGTLLGVGGGFSSTALIQDQKNDLTGGTFTSGAPRTRDLNTIIHNNIGLTLNANRFTLLAGTYIFQARCPSIRVRGNQAWLVEDPAGSPSILFHGDGTDSAATTTGGVVGPMFSNLSGEIVASVTTEYEIQHQCGTTISTVGFGNKGQFQVNPSVFTTALIIQVA